ncbi:MAG: hypothetical protein EP329_26140 [Deltaproteobacteria bacterium]|nr:MAG: hypothetical protein EP329_26140 [Deltaproteobacteria bacterium]
MREPRQLPDAPPSPSRTWPVAMVAILLLAIVGAVINVESTTVYVNLRVAPDDFVSACNISETINCDAVERSAWATLWGVPTALWAVVAYAVVAALAIAGLWLGRRRRERGILLLVSAVSVGFGLFLAGLMAFEIGAWCTLCLATDAVNVAMLVLVLVACRADGCSPVAAIRSDLGWLFSRPLAFVGHLSLAAVALAAGFGATAAWVQPPIDAALAAETEAAERPTDALEEAHNPGAAPASQRWAGEAVPSPGCDRGEDCDCAEHRAPRAGAVVQSEDDQGHPWVGGPDAVLVVEEFTDYQCPHCRSAHMRMRRLLSEYPGQIRVVHRHFPLDGACNRLLTGRVFHPRACELSRVAVCAGEQGRFWEMNDLLFQRQDEIRRDGTSADALARRLELDMDDFQCCMAAEATGTTVTADIEAGIRLRLTGTPAYVIDGVPHLGSLPPDALAVLKPSARPAPDRHSGAP